MTIKTNGKKLVVGVGSALVDILTHEDDAFLKEISDIKGGMTLVDAEFSDSVLPRATGTPEIVPGGATCNTIVGIGKIGGESRFVGKLGTDEMGRFFETELIKSNVKPVLLKSETITGKVLSIITPDAQRSMFTYLGASSEILPEEIRDDFFDGAAIAMIEGYMLFNHDLIMTVLEAAKKTGALIALDLASFTVVEENREILEGIVKNYVDILIANEDEARAFTGHTDEMKALSSLAENVEIGVLKVGKRGSYISCSGEVVRVDAMGSGNAVDTTGAGDLWAAGFLYGIVSGYPLEKCGEIASACGYAVCQVVGAAIPDKAWEEIRELL